MADEQSAEEREYSTQTLIPQVYDELRRLAASRIKSEAPGQTITGTALVHEVFLRFNAGEKSPQWKNDRQFFYAAAEAMRRIVIDRFRAKSRLKRGSNAEKVEFIEAEVPAMEANDRLLAINEALDKLEEEDPESAELVKLRFFVGLTMEETAEVIGVSERTLRRRWSYARAWLTRHLNAEGA